MQVKTIRDGIFLFLFIFLAMPLLEYKFSFFKSKQLNGYFISTALPKFSLHDWWNGEYQNKMNSHFNDSIGFRPDFVRMNNQVDFWLFRKLHADQIAEGKEGCYFEKAYLDEYCGNIYPDDAKVTEQIRKLKLIQDTMAKQGKFFVFAYAPSKAYYYNDLLPKEWKYNPGASTYYKSFRRICDSFGINEIDFNGWFVAMKGKTHDSILSKQGVHWTNYGALLAADSLMKYIEQHKKTHLPRINWTSVRYEAPKEQEQDIFRLLNLIFCPFKERFSYPDFHFIEDNTTVKPKTIYLGDSYYWTMQNNYLFDNLSKNWEFWYYFNEVYTRSVVDGKARLMHIDSYKWQQSLSQCDILIMLYTEPNLVNLGSGFIEKAYSYYYPTK